jgi:hypothetical protein
MQQLSTLGDDQMAVAISADADVIIGSMRTLVPNAGTFATTNDLFVWTPSSGLRKLTELVSLTDPQEVDLLADPQKALRFYDVSDDGRVVFGASTRVVDNSNPYRPIMRNDYWLLDIGSVPEPPTYLLGLLSLCGGVLRPQRSNRTRHSRLESSSSARPTISNC